MNDKAVLHFQLLLSQMETASERLTTPSYTTVSPFASFSPFPFFSDTDFPKKIVHPPFSLLRTPSLYSGVAKVFGDMAYDML